MKTTSRPPDDLSARPCRFYSAGHCKKGSDCKFSHGNESSLASSSQCAPISAVEVVKPPGTHSRDDCQKSCRFWKAGHCKKGSDCKFSHGNGGPQASNPWDASTSAADVVNPTGTPCQDECRTPCRYWKSEDCKKVSDCKFSHVHCDSSASHCRSVPDGAVMREIKTPNGGESECHGTQGVQIQRCPSDGSLTPRDTPQRSRWGDSVCHLWKANNCTQGDNCWYLHADDIPTDPKAAQKEAAETIGRVVQGSIVTYGAGLDIVDLTTGCEACTLRVKNVPSDTEGDAVRAMMTQQGVNASRFYIVGIQSVGGGKIEAEIMTDEQLGWDLLAIFKQNGLQVEVSAPNTSEGMAASSVQDATVLTLSWPSPAAQYAVRYIDADVARTKVRQLDGYIHNDRRIKARMNDESSGRTRTPLEPHTVTIISNLPPDIGHAEVMTFSGSRSVKRLKSSPSLSVHEVEDHLRDVISCIAPGRVRSLGHSLLPDPNGFLSVRARFCSRDDALAVQTSLKTSKYGKDVGMRLTVPHPLDFTLSLGLEQYNAQRSQWDALMGSLKDPKACMLNIQKQECTVRVCLSGSQNDALGALKVKVENLARGETVQGWHRALAHPKNNFSKQVLAETGAYMRVDQKVQVLKVYGSAMSTERARKMIGKELDRLSSSDFTATVPKPAVRILISGGGLAQLKETFGEDTVKFDVTSRRITISGGEQARYALNSIIRSAMKTKPSAASQSETACPICLDDISVPFHLGCRHTYCVACLRHFLLSALEGSDFPLRCLGSDGHCGVPISIPAIQRFLSLSSFNRLLEVAFNFYLSRRSNEFKYCKTPDCAQIYRSTDSKARLTLLCPSCFLDICTSCGDSHDGLQRCADVKRRQAEEEERQNNAWIAAQGQCVKRCPRCGILIEKLEGCNHVACRCGAHICWTCMRTFAEGKIYRHIRHAHDDGRRCLIM
ncbi:hypothetical protein EV401DRAFT_1136071 [Pisolithus croceorrhizus]|nr:hypothetical protein EV401DRAFT_1136071 [Pisolithus croceorrhizus]